MISTWERRGNIVTPACPPTTGTLTSLGSTPSTSAYNTQYYETEMHITKLRRTTALLEYASIPGS
jgi:hypothetical protein